MNRLDKIIGDMAFILDNLMLLRQIQGTGDCNVCKNRECGYMPKAGQMVRYNCPFYKAESEIHCNCTDKEIAKKDRVKVYYEPVNGKPGYVWLSHRNLQMISIEALAKALKFDQEYPALVDVKEETNELESKDKEND